MESEKLNTYIRENDFENYLKWSLIDEDDELQKEVYKVDFDAMVKQYKGELETPNDYLQYKMNRLFNIIKLYNNICKK